MSAGHSVGGGARIALGTAQFGFDYGVTNIGGKVPGDVVRVILDRATAIGVRWLDTAAAYGEAEQVLGDLEGAREHFRVTTKVAAAYDGADLIDQAEQQFKRSLRRLRRTRVDALLVHDASHLEGPFGPELYGWLRRQRESGRAAAIGASVYDGGQAVRLARRYALDWVQLPLSVLDQRAVLDGSIDRLRADGVGIQARSALLQGLVLAEPQALPPAFAAAREPLARLRAAAATLGVPVLTLALAFVARHDGVQQIVLGAVSAVQLDECVAALGQRVDADWGALACTDIDVTDPRSWPPDVRVPA